VLSRIHLNNISDSTFSIQNAPKKAEESPADNIVIIAGVVVIIITGIAGTAFFIRKRRLKKPQIKD